jgi:hypothetical protein
MHLRSLLTCASLASLAACAPLRPALRTGPPPAAPAGALPLAAVRPDAEAVLLAVAEAAAAGPAEEGAGAVRAESPELQRLREAVVRRAGTRVGRRTLGVPGFMDDCAGLVRDAYHAAGADPMPRASLAGENAVTGMWREAEARGALRADPLALPAPGDLAFFRETYDRNRDGKRNDGLTHVGVVESVDPDGTVVFIHRGVRGIARSRFNAAKPTVHAEEGRILNAWLRARSRTLRAYMAGELYVGYASAAQLLTPAPASDLPMAATPRAPVEHLSAR